MSLRDYCTPDAVLCNFEVADKEDAIRRLIDALVEAKAIPKTKATAICREVIERERQASTGIGKGIGIPHARSQHAKRISMAIGLVNGGIEFGAVDGERVSVILLLISPQANTDEHLAAMKEIVTIARDPYQRQRLLGCRSPESFLDLLAEIGGQKV
ncbi:MAG: PTS sugar transporter subunit IIA [Planctomycetota bacterium]|jgi:mannitol/fructose-specific phosphotransferase system IIA component (Ntr-type)